jgi:hypothetical protein
VRRDRARRWNGQALEGDPRIGAPSHSGLLDLGEGRASGERGETGVLVDPCNPGGTRRIGLPDERAVGQARHDGEGCGQAGHQGRREAHGSGQC